MGLFAAAEPQIGGLAGGFPGATPTTALRQTQARACHRLCVARLHVIVHLDGIQNPRPPVNIADPFGRGGSPATWLNVKQCQQSSGFRYWHEPGREDPAQFTLFPASTQVACATSPDGNAAFLTLFGTWIMIIFLMPV